MKYLSVFSGIEAASVAWKDLPGWEAQGYSEIDPYASALLNHHYPKIKNYGDITQHPTWGITPGSVDILIGGSPCQSYSVAGKRLGLEDPRGQLMFSFLDLASAIKCRFICWENVPGVLSSNGGNDFKCFLQALADRGYGFAWRVLDAQYIGGSRAVPQRRKRVFLIASLDGWECCTKILSFHEGLCWDIEKGRKKREEAASNSGTGPGQCRTFRKSKRASSVNDDESWVAADKANTLNTFDLGDIRTTHAVIDDATLFENHGQDSRIKECKEIAPTVVQKFGTGGNNTPLVTHTDQPPLPVDFRNNKIEKNPNISGTIQSKPNGGFSLNYTTGILYPASLRVRRLTPLECSRLMGFPDNYTQIPWKGKPAENCPDSLQYKALGNSMAVPCIQWIGQRINDYVQGRL